MNIKQTLQTVLVYFERTRGLGHTKLAKEALKIENLATLLVVDKKTGEALGIANANYITLEDLEYRTQGRRMLLVFDNYTIINICADALSHIRALEHDRDELIRKLKIINGVSKL
jgi:hypothetical protein